MKTILSRLFAAKKAVRPALRFEALENRNVPAVLVQPVGDVLRITGDDSANEVVIRQTDTSVTVDVYGGAPDQGHYYYGLDTYQWARQKIEVDLKGRDDTLRYSNDDASTDSAKWLTVNLGTGDDVADIAYPGSSRLIKAPVTIAVDAGTGEDTVTAAFSRFQGGMLDFTANLGDNNDSATVSLQGDLLNRSTVSVKMYGQGGGDNLFFETKETASVYQGLDGVFDQTSDSDMDVSLSGGDGNDVVRANLDGEFNAVVNLSVQGDGGRYDAGNDRIQALMNLRSGSYGWVNTRVYGGAGNDIVQLDYSGAGISQARKDFLVDGGIGYDYLVPSFYLNLFPNLNCEGTCNSIWSIPGLGQ